MWKLSLFLSAQPYGNLSGDSEWVYTLGNLPEKIEYIVYTKMGDSPTTIILVYAQF